MMNKLFEAVPGEPDGPSLGELYKKCPVDFRRLDNTWNQLAASIRIGGGVDGTAWKPRSKDPEVITNQAICLLAVTSATVIDRSAEVQHMQDSVAAWMLHEMLAERPTYLPLTKIQ